MPMPIRARISHEVENAFRDGNLVRRDTLRMAQNAMYLASKREHRSADGGDGFFFRCDDEQALEVLFGEVRQRKEQEAAFRHDGEREMATREAQEILILQEFLPPALGSEELEQLVTAGIAAVGAANPRDTHRVMLRLTPALRGRADLRAVTALINRRLAPLRPGQESPSLDRGAPSPA